MSDINWTVPQLSFPLTVPLLGLPTYTYSSLVGLIVSVGGLTESTVRSSSLKKKKILLISLLIKKLLIALNESLSTTVGGKSPYSNFQESNCIWIAKKNKFRIIFRLYRFVSRVPLSWATLEGYLRLLQVWSHSQITYWLFLESFIKMIVSFYRS